MIAIPTLHISTDSNNLAVFAISFKGHAVHDISMDEGCTTQVDPSYYGLSKLQADFLTKMNRTLEKATTSALNAGCADIQDAFGIGPGDLAGVYFSDDRRIAPMRQMFAEYLLRELNQALC